MFYYEIRSTRKRQRGEGRTATRTEHMEALKPEYVGEKIAALLDKREVVRVTVQPISQAAYIRATRAD